MTLGKLLDFSEPEEFFAYFFSLLSGNLSYMGDLFDFCFSSHRIVGRLQHDREITSSAGGRPATNVSGVHFQTNGALEQLTYTLSAWPNYQRPKRLRGPSCERLPKSEPTRRVTYRHWGDRRVCVCVCVAIPSFTPGRHI